MPTILTPQGWVKVSEAPVKRRTVTVDPTDALKGPLAYFSCKRSPPKVFPGTLNLPSGAAGHGRGNVSREAFPYDLSASPEKLRAQGRVFSSQVEKVKIGGKNRTVSAPVPDMHAEDDRYQSEQEAYGRQKYSTRSSSPPPAPGPAPHSSRHRESKHQHHHHKSRSQHHDDDASSVSSRSTSSSTSSRSYRSHERHRPMEAAPQPVIMYHTPAPAPASPRYMGGMGPGYYNYPPPGSYESPRSAHPPPPSSGSGRSMTYSWFNATTPLNL